MIVTIILALVVALLSVSAAAFVIGVLQRLNVSYLLQVEEEIGNRWNAAGGKVTSRKFQEALEDAGLMDGVAVFRMFPCDATAAQENNTYIVFVSCDRDDKHPCTTITFAHEMGHVMVYRRLSEATKTIVKVVRWWGMVSTLVLPVLLAGVSLLGWNIPIVGTALAVASIIAQLVTLRDESAANREARRLLETYCPAVVEEAPAYFWAAFRAYLSFAGMVAVLGGALMALCLL